MNYSLICHGKRSQSYEPEESQTLLPGFLRIAIKKATICGSDYMVLNGTHPYKKYPAILGHEFIGQVVEITEGVPFYKEQWVTGLSYGCCETCSECQQKRQNHCKNKITYNTVGTSGAFTRYMIVHYSSLIALPNQNNILPEYVLSEPLSIIMHAMRKVSLGADENVVIIGGGAMGLLSAIYCHEVKSIKNIKIVDNNYNRQNFSESLGYETRSDLSETKDNSINLLIISGGSKLDINYYLKYLSPSAKIIIISYFDTPLLFDMNTLVRKEVTIFSSFLSDRIDLSAAADMIKMSEKKNSSLKKLLTKEISFSELKDFMLDQNSVGKVIVNKLGELP